ncbi:MAG: Fe(3+) ABC transporter substrate-binding protein [Woeseiaceae bacterium]|nr:Fe(3+) ABC transporter substrate-binding protein [Woeseiaceae bacterium]
MLNRILGGFIVTSLLLVGCGTETNSETGTTPADAPGANGVVNVYSSRHYDTDLALYEDFTAATGIEVNRIEAGADELIARIQSEGEFSPADLLITVDAGRLWRAEEAGIFAPIESEVLSSRIPESLRHSEGAWFGLSTRARVIVYNKAAGVPEGLATYQDLADPAYAGKVCIRSSGNIYNISLLASIVSRYGSEAAEEWARGVVANFAREPQSNDTGQIRAVASGECQIGVANTYYIARLKASDNPEDNAIVDNIGVIFPNQGTTGTHVNISGAGVIKTAPNRDNAIRFLEYLTTESAQQYFANGNHEYPAVAGLPGSDALQSLGSFEADSLNAGELGVHQAEAVKVFDRAGWK